MKSEFPKAQWGQDQLHLPMSEGVCAGSLLGHHCFSKNQYLRLKKCLVQACRSGAKSTENKQKPLSTCIFTKNELAVPDGHRIPRPLCPTCRADV